MSKAFGPKGPIIRGFWAILMLRVTSLEEVIADAGRDDRGKIAARLP